MSYANKSPAAARKHKARGLRDKLRRHTNRPRLSVFRSLTNISAQIIDDAAGTTLVSASSLDKVLRDGFKGMKKLLIAEKIGQAIAERAKEKGVKQVAFDRGAYRFHGRVKALADAARKGGLEF